MWYYKRINTLAAEGIRSSGGVFEDSSAAQIAQWLEIVPSVEAIEPPNEYDSSHGASISDWAASDVEITKRLSGQIKGNSRFAKIVVLGPSTSNVVNAALLGDLSHYIDVGNIHDYPCDHYPGNGGFGNAYPPFGAYGSIAFTINVEKTISGAKPIWTTEVGYDDNRGSECYTPDSVIAKYYPRALLERWNAGITRVYFFQFANVSGDKQFGSLGMLDSEQRPKPQYYALKNLIDLFSDRGPSFAPRPLMYKISSTVSTVHHALFEKRDGSFLLALWNEVPALNPSGEQSDGASRVLIRLEFARPLSKILSLIFETSGSVVRTYLPRGSTVTMNVSDNLRVLQLFPKEQ